MTAVPVNAKDLTTAPTKVFDTAMAKVSPNPTQKQAVLHQRISVPANTPELELTLAKFTSVDVL